MSSSTKISVYLGTGPEAVKLEATLSAKAKDLGLSLSEYVVQVLKASLDPQ